MPLQSLNWKYMCLCKYCMYRCNTICIVFYRHTYTYMCIYMCVSIRMIHNTHIHILVYDIYLIIYFKLLKKNKSVKDLILRLKAVGNEHTHIHRQWLHKSVSGPKRSCRCTAWKSLLRHFFLGGWLRTPWFRESMCLFSQPDLSFNWLVQLSRHHSEIFLLLSLPWAPWHEILSPKPQIIGCKQFLNVCE